VLDGLARADAVVLMGDDPHGLVQRLETDAPILRARLVPGPEQASLRGQPVVAFAGIGEPRKFFATLQAIGARVVARHPFEDHHAFRETDIQPILDEAFALGAVPVTTEKDAVRLAPDQRQQVNVLTVDVAWDNIDALERLLGRVKL
jgi:tetraacyldisaccharide 4'-kinase